MFNKYFVLLNKYCVSLLNEQIKTLNNYENKKITLNQNGNALVNDAFWDVWFECADKRI